MRIAPVTMQSRQTQQDPAFGALKFKLDQNSKTILVNTCLSAKYNSVQTNKFIVNVENSLKKLNNVAKVITQGLLDNNQKTRGLSVDDVWANDTKVKLSIRLREQKNGRNILVAKFNNEEFADENVVKLAQGKSAVKDSSEEKNLLPTPEEAMSFMRGISDARLKFTRFVGTNLKNQPDYKMIDNDYSTDPAVELGHMTLNSVVREWIYDGI